MTRALRSTLGGASLLGPARTRAVFAALVASGAAFASSARATQVERAEKAGLELRAGDRVCLIGNALAERMQHHGWLETRLQRRFPELGLRLRNLGFSADELTIRQRTAGFGSPDEHLRRCGATVVLAFFGAMESFAGEAGLAGFRRDLADLVEHTLAQRYDGREPPRLVLASPIACEDLGTDALPPAGEANARLAPYVRAMVDVAAEKEIPFVDLFTPTRERFAEGDALTLNGLHLTEAGNRFVAEVIERALFGDATTRLDEDDVERLRAAVLRKNLLWFNRYRATDGYNVYGGRSTLSYGGVTNREVLQRELEVLDAMTANADAEIHALARGEEPPEAAPVPELLEVATNRPGDGPDGAHRFQSGEEAIADMALAQGLEVRLFADEQRFGALANPVQMTWDARGRLWVAVWPSYPHWKPGDPMDDKLLILTDEDGDGRADHAQTFASGLHNPTGFELWNGGVLVANPPDLLFLADTDGDDAADVRRRILHGLGSADTHHAANSFVIGPEGALYFQEGTFHRSQIETVRGPVRNHDACVWRFDPRTWLVERYVPYGFANPHGHVFDRWGQDFVTDGTSNLNYYALPISGYLPFPARHLPYFTFLEQRSRPAAATEILSSTSFPAESQGNYLIANVIGFQGIFQYALADDGAGFAATEVEPIVQSADPSFRPVDVEVGPDGALYFLDWQNPLIGHMQHHLRDPSRDHAHGRVYRVSVAGSPARSPIPIAGRPVSELVALLASPEDRIRYRVRGELSARDSNEVVAAARAWAAGLAADAPHREHHLLEALWLQCQHNVLDADLLARLLDAADFRARAAATRVVRHMRHRIPDPLPLLEGSLADEHPRVRLEALVALGSFQGARAAELALRVLSAPTDRFLDYALAETLRALEPWWRGALARGEPFAADDPTGLAHVLAMLDTSELLVLPPSVAVHRERLARHGLGVEPYVHSARALAEEGGSSAADELLAAIRRADERGEGHVDHLLSGLFRALRALEGDEPETAEALGTLALEGRRASTRRLATAARLQTGGSLDAFWSEARATAKADVLDAAPFLRGWGDDDGPEESLADELFDRALAVLAEADEEDERQGTYARYVRVELPGPSRTLTLAEVQVFQGDENIAPLGTATQSSVNWDGTPDRAIDGNTSGVFADGGQTHTIEDQPDPWWELDLGGDYWIERITLWNRTEAEGRWLGRLDGFVVRVLDRERRTVTELRGGEAPNPTVTLELPSPSVRLRRSAVRALTALGVHREEALAEIVRQFVDAELRPTAVRALRDLAATFPVSEWSDVPRDTLASTLESHLRTAPPESFATREGRELLALADDLLLHLPAARVEPLARLRRGLGPRLVVIRPVPDRLLYDRVELTVQAGRTVELTLDNVDIMPHNLVVTAPGALATVGLAAEAMAKDADAWTRGFVPEVPEVLVATRLVQPGESQTLTFEAPAAPGDYPYVCTFPGHWIRMNGVLHVVAEEPAGDAPPTDASTPAAPAAPTRPFVRSWTHADLAPYLDRISAGDAGRGRVVFEAASCIHCHAVPPADGGADGVEGGRTGPLLAEVVPRYSRSELLRHILEPSLAIAAGYEAEVFVTERGGILAGRVLAEDAERVVLLDDPYRDEGLELPKDEIRERWGSELSIMPSELLSTFERQEILDLLAYLESLKP